MLGNALSNESSGNVSVFYVDKNKATKFLRSSGVQFPGVMSIMDGYVHSIRDNGPPVKGKFQNVTQTKQFKRWFGDWETHAKAASKVVNEDGAPRIVYHGTTENFTVFECGDVGYHVGTKHRLRTESTVSKTVMGWNCMQTKIAETPNDSVVGKTTQISSGISADSSIPQSGENVNSTGVSVTEMQQPKGINVRTYESGNEESRLETLNKLDGVRFSKDVDTEADSKITQYDIEQLRSIGSKSIFDFTHEDIQKSEKWAKKFYSELGAKSPFFRAWFGDWRANDTEKINIVSVPTIDIKDATLEYGDYHINDTGWDVYAGRTLKDDTTHHSGGERINVKL